jgi:arsenate reductase
MKRVLILCTGNSCRSQMAEALWNELGRGAWTADSAGSKPAGYVHPLAVEAMREIDLDIAEGRSKSLEEFRGQSFDLVITVCEHAKESCPVFLGAQQAHHWPLMDPAEATGTHAQRLTQFRLVRNQLRDQITAWLHDNQTSS